jgi:uncharacterized protein (DUF1330 family)
VSSPANARLPRGRPWLKRDGPCQSLPAQCTTVALVGIDKTYWAVCYRSISDPRDAYTKLAVPAGGGAILARGLPAKTYEGGIDQATVLVEFGSLEQAIAAHDSPDYQAALSVLGNAAERDLRIVEGING